MANEPKQEQPKPSPLGIAAGIGGGVIGMVVGQYAGLMLLIPAGIALLAGFILQNVVPTRNKPMVPASAVQLGQGMWMAVGVIVLSRFELTSLEAVVLVLGAVWLAVRPSLVVVVPLVCYHLFGLAVNGMMFANETPGSPTHKALLVHLSLRVFAVGAMLYGIQTIRAADTAQPSVDGTTGDAAEPGAD